MFLFQFQVGVKQEERVIHSIDPEYWADVLGAPLEAPVQAITRAKKPKVKFPLMVEARHRGKTYVGELLDLTGTLRFEGKEYSKPSIAAKIIATEWKQVNGWKFWKYEDPETGEWEYISKLRGE